MKPCLIGFVKCGQTSLVKFLRQKGINKIDWPENILRFDGFDNYLKIKDTHYPVVIIRNRIEAIWSMFWFWKYNEKMTYKQFLELDITTPHYGNESPLYRTEFEYHYKKYIPYGLKIYNLEELKKQIDFPHENNISHPIINEQEIQLTKKAILRYHSTV